MKRKVLWLVLGAVVLTLAGVGLGLAVYEANKPEMTAHGRTSDESAKLNDAFLNYVHMGNPELESEPNGNLLAIGYRVCQDRDNYSRTVFIYNIEEKYPNAGARIYDGATQYLC
jgi:hypothetical protein